MEKFLSVVVGIAIGFIVFVGVAGAAVLNFDDLPSNDYGVYIPLTYGSLNSFEYVS